MVLNKDRIQPEEEDSATLTFSKEFQNATALSVSEVNFIMEAARNRDILAISGKVMPPAYTATQSHVSRFSNFSDEAALTVLRRSLTQDIFTSFEVAQLINLCAETPEEAKALIPSLASKIDDDTLAFWLIEIKTSRKFQTTSI